MATLTQRPPDSSDSEFEVPPFVPPAKSLPGQSGLFVEPVQDGQVRLANLQNRLAHWRLEREIGRGGMGVVYEAFDTVLSRRVAIKLLPTMAALEPKKLARFEHEAQVVARLSHPHIVSLYSMEVDGELHFLVMQLIDGVSLDRVAASTTAALSSGSPDGTRILRTQASDESSGASTNHPKRERGRTLQNASDSQSSEAPALAHASGDLNDSDRWLHDKLFGESAAAFRYVATLGWQAAEALSYAHSMGVIHRDVKPSNLVVDHDDNLWITDFGLAQIQGEQGVTMTGDLLGTLRYMSPEQGMAQRIPVDHRTDVYSLGVTLYELFAKRPAFEAEDRKELLRQVLFDDPVPLRKHDPHIPPPLQIIVEKAMQKDPRARYATARALADDLRRWLDGEPILARPPTVIERVSHWAARRKGAVATGLVSLFVLLVALAVLGQRHAGELRQELAKTEAARAEAVRGEFEALLLQAQSGRAADSPGRRLRSLEAVTRAAELGRKLSLSDADQVRLRTETIAALAVPFDVEPLGDIELDFPGWLSILDPAFEQIARVTSSDGTITVSKLNRPQVEWQGVGPPSASNPLSLVPTLRVGTDTSARRVGMEAEMLDAKSVVMNATHRVGRGVPTRSVGTSETSARATNSDSRITALKLPPSLADVSGIRLPGFGVLPGFWQFSLDGRRLIVEYGSVGGTVIVWNLETGERAYELTLPAGRGWSSVVSVGDRLLAAVDSANELRLFDLIELREVSRTPFGAAPMAIALANELPGQAKSATTKSDRYLAVGHASPDRVEVFEVGKPEVVKTIAAPGSLTLLLRSLSSGLVGSCRTPTGFAFWDLANAVPFTTVEQSVFMLDVAPQGDVIALEDSTGNSGLRDVRTGLRGLRLNGRLIGFDATGELLALRTTYRVSLYRVHRSSQVRRIRPPGQLASGTIYNVSFDSNSRVMAVSSPGGARLYDVASGELLDTVSSLPVTNVAFAEADDLLVSAVGVPLQRWRKVGDLWEEFERKFAAVEPTSPASVAGNGFLSLTRDGRVIARSQFSNEAIVWREATNVTRLGPHPGLSGVALSPDGKQCVTGQHISSGLLLWDTSTGERLRDVWPDVSSVTATFSSDGRWLLASAGREFRLFNTTDWQVVWQHAREDGSDAAAPIAFSPDARQFVIAHNQSTLRLHSIRDSADQADPTKLDCPLFAEFPLPEPGYIGTATFSPNGRWLARNTDRVVFVWDLHAISDELGQRGIAGFEESR